MKKARMIDPDYIPPAKKVCKRKKNQSYDVCCIICAGGEGPLSEEDKKRNVTGRGLSKLLQIARDRGDDAAGRILELEKKKAHHSLMFHNNCRVRYVFRGERFGTLQKLSETLAGYKSQEKPVLRSKVAPLNFKIHCFVCGKDGKGRFGDELSYSIKNPEKLWEDVLSAACQRDDKPVLQRLQVNSGFTPNVLRYHRKSCYELYVNKRNVQCARSKMSDDNQKKTTIYKQVGATLCAELHSRVFDKQEVLLLTDARERYIELLTEAGVNPDVANDTQSSLVKSKLIAGFGNKVTFFHGRGRSDFFCSVGITVGRLKAHMDTLLPDGSQCDEPLALDEDRIIYEAARILRQEIKDIPETKAYPSSDEVSVDDSEALLPKKLKRMIQLLLDNDAATSEDEYFVSDETNRRWYVAICESIVYCSRRGRNSQVLPPLQIGLMLQLYHQYGSRTLIDTLHSHGFCASYDELRLFLSTAAKHDVEGVQSGAYIPPGLIPRNGKSTNSSLIHEGNDNIDINVETVDGKNTYHSMARVIFQDQNSSEFTTSARLARPRLESHQNRTFDDDTEQSLTRPLSYVKPKKKPEFTRCKDPQSLVDTFTKHFNVCVRDLSWCLLRRASRENSNAQSIPFWTGFNSMLTKKQDTKTVALYAPTVESSPTDLSTVYTVLKRGSEMTRHLEQAFQVHTFDQQLYVLAQQVKWARPQEFSGLTLRLGGFHTLCTFIACIGTLWGDSGLKDLLAESGVYAPGTVESMLGGHQFHRAVRGLTLSFEVLMERFVTALLKWIATSEQQQLQSDPNSAPDRIWSVIVETEKAIKDNNNPSAAVEKLDRVIFKIFLNSVERFREYGSAKSPIFMHWLECLDALQVMLINIRSEREGNWGLHLESVIAMVPYFFACNRQNYSRWASIYVVDMLANLPPDVKEAFEAGQFSIKRSAGRYNGIWSDMGVESTVIRDSKSRSGIIGLTGKGTSLLRWSLTRQLLGRYSSSMQERSGCGRSSLEEESHEQQRPAMFLQDEKHAQQMMKHLENNFIDPFDVDDHPTALVNISSGLHATDTIQKSLLTAIQAGKNSFERFMHERLSTDGRKSIWDPIPRSGLATFTDLNKPTKVNVASKMIKAAVSAEVVFRRSLAISAARPEVNISTILSRPITTVPTMLFKEDGRRQTTPKAELTHWLEERATSLPSIPPCEGKKSIYIVDGMADVQAINGDVLKTFHNLGDKLLRNVIPLFNVAEEVHVVYDRYDEKDSVKADERSARMVKGQHVKTYTVMAGGNIPPWRKFLNSMENKEALAQFLSHHLINNSVEHFSKPEHTNKRLFVSGGFEDRQTAKCASSLGVSECKHLEATHEEADTRMIFHLIDADKRMIESGFSSMRAIIKTPDTDVVCLAVHFFGKLRAITELWIHTGSVGKTVDRVRFIPIHEVCSAVGSVVCSILPAVHALTGCDSVSSLYFIGKQKPMKIVSCSSDDFADLVALGKESERDAVDAARKLFIELYYPKHKHRLPPLENLNDLRIRLATRDDQSLSRMPRCEDSFLQHVRRASWQTKIWMEADQAQRSSSTESPIGHGWCKENDKIVPVFFQGETAAELLDDLVCSCNRRSKCARNCTCSLNNLPCIDLCSCSAAEDCCINPQSHKVVNEYLEES